MTEIGRPPPHKTTHQAGGNDELTLAGMTPGAHKTTHQNGGSDQIDLTGLTRSPVFVDRGDPAAYDYTLTNFTQDNAYHDLDLSAIIPAGAIAVLIIIEYYLSTLGYLINFRKNGNANERNIAQIRPTVQDVWSSQQIIVSLDANRIIEYKITGDAFGGLNATISGWWI